jgi:E3 ubiquitin-protein ligase RAD18
VPPLLQSMRAALVCDACHDLLEVPMILPHCGHTFCSRCIRSYLDSKGPVLGDCPSCREKVRPDELVRNVKLREVIAQYRQLEASLVAQAQTSDEIVTSAEDSAMLSAATARSGPAKRPRTSPTQEDSDSDFEGEAPPARKRTRPSGSSRAAAGGRRSSRLSARPDAAASPTSPASQAAADVVDLSQDTNADSASGIIHERGSGGDGRVECPICSMSISARNINSHMDTCLSKTTAATPRSSSPVDQCAERPESTGPTGGATAAAVPAATAARMPKMTYHVLKDPQLRKLCRDLGLSTRGDRTQLEWRHRQYAQEHNTACDAEEAPIPKQIVVEIERRERNMAAPTQSRPSIFSRQTSRQRESATDAGADNATAAADSTGNTYRDTSQDAAFEELIQQIEARLGRRRKRVYTYVYESAEEDGEEQAPPAHPAAMFRICAHPAGYSVDLCVGVHGIRLTELVPSGCSDTIAFAGLSWEITDDGLTLMYTSTAVSTAGAAGSSRTERTFRCQKEVAMEVQCAIIAAMQAERRRRQEQQEQEQQPAALATLGNGTAADMAPGRTDSADSLAVSPPADALTTVLSAATDSGMASASAVVPDAEADAKVCRVCYCGEGELDCPVPVTASANDAAPADLVQPCKCNSWIHRKCLQDWISSRSASTDERRRCEVCEEPIGAADREGALQAAPPPSAAQLRAVGIKKFSALCGYQTCSLAGTGAHYHCVLGHDMAGRKCVYSSKDAKQAERHGVAMTRLVERRRRASAPSMVGAHAWSRVAA